MWRHAPNGDKVMRLPAQTATIENGFVFLPDEAPWLADYLAEMTAFPAGRHDDQVDSTAQMLRMKRTRTTGEGCGRGGVDWWAKIERFGEEAAFLLVRKPVAYHRCRLVRGEADGRLSAITAKERNDP